MGGGRERFLESRELTKWGKSNGRDFPWRQSRDPYRILMAEVMLHRTRAAQVVPVYVEFLRRFPTMQTLIKAPKGEITEMLRPLGLVWRARLVSQLCGELDANYSCRLPCSTRALSMLPGVGPYIAGAIGCFAYGRPEVLLDTNTVRVLSRVFGVRASDSSRRTEEFKGLMSSAVDQLHPTDFYYALIDLAATICTTRNPKCMSCPLSRGCAFYRKVGSGA